LGGPSAGGNACSAGPSCTLAALTSRLPTQRPSGTATPRSGLHSTSTAYHTNGQLPLPTTPTPTQAQQRSDLTRHHYGAPCLTTALTDCQRLRRLTPPACLQHTGPRSLPLQEQSTYINELPYKPFSTLLTQSTINQHSSSCK
jgi:hypothetical protein